MTVHGFGVDAPRAADAPQIGEQPLQAGLISSYEFIRFFKSQTLEGQAGTREALRDTVFGFVVGEDEDFNARVQQGLDDIALQEVDDRHAVVGRDEDFFGH